MNFPPFKTESAGCPASKAEATYDTASVRQGCFFMTAGSQRIRDGSNIRATRTCGDVRLGEIDEKPADSLWVTADKNFSPFSGVEPLDCRCRCRR